jgi:hypothetical protein
VVIAFASIKEYTGFESRQDVRSKLNMHYHFVYLRKINTSKEKKNFIHTFIEKEHGANLRPFSQKSTLQAMLILVTRGLKTGRIMRKIREVRPVKMSFVALEAWSSGIVYACQRGDWSLWVARSNPVRV